MANTSPKPWVLIVAGAAIVPLAWYAGFLVADTFACGAGHALIFAMLLVLWLPRALGVAIATAAILLLFRRRGFSNDRLGSAIRALVFVAASAAVGYVIYLRLGDPSFCNIQL